ncbi:unnamed protein product [Rotaria sp. Silwood1]|nr:unnamed protein product [Rotaria sp. Silwood1]
MYPSQDIEFTGNSIIVSFLKLSSISSRTIGLNQSPSDNMIDSNSRSPSNPNRLLKKSPIKKTNEETGRFSRELEQRLQNGDISEEAKHAYNLLINGCTNNSSLSHEEHLHSTSHDDLSLNNNEIDNNNTKQSLLHPSTILFGSSSSSSSTSISTSSTSNNTQSNTSSSSSSGHQKSDRHSHYSSTSTDNDISIDLKSQNDLSPLKLLRNGINPSNLISKSIRQQISTNEINSSNHSPISSTSNTLSNLSITSPLYDHHHLLLPPPSQSSSSSNNDDNRSISSLNSRSLSTNKSEQNSITGQPLPPPPDLSSLGSKLTTATMTHTLKLPVPLTSSTSTSNAYRSKSMKIIFIR